jgi:protein-S-isoprenylcysteine O-methyltransferase Ste14
LRPLDAGGFVAARQNTTLIRASHALNRTLCAPCARSGKRNNRQHSRTLQSYFENQVFCMSLATPGIPDQTNLKPTKRLNANKTYRLRGAFGLLLLIPATVVALFSQPLVREGTWLNIVVNALAWVVFVAGISFRIWSTLYVGSRKLKTLVNQGPYSICRNPLYVGTFLMALGAALFLKSFLVIAAVILLIVVYAIGTVPAEEKALLAQHGEAYAEYLRRVPRFFPNFSLFTTPPSVEVKINGVRLEAKRLLIYIWMPVLGQAITYLRGLPWWPHWFRPL